MEYTKEFIAKAIRNYRLDKDMSMQDLADKLRISRNQINRWENGHSMPNLMSIHMLKQAGILKP